MLTHVGPLVSLYGIVLLYEPVESGCFLFGLSGLSFHSLFEAFHITWPRIGILPGNVKIRISP